MAHLAVRRTFDWLATPPIGHALPMLLSRTLGIVVLSLGAWCAALSPATCEAQLADASAAYVAGDYGRAEQLLHSLVGTNARDPLPLCLLGEVQRERGDLEAALASFGVCEETARRLGIPGRTHQARALVGRALTLERSPERLAEARTAWSAVLRFAESSGGTVDASVARARVAAIDARMATDATAQAVRARRQASAS